MEPCSTARNRKLALRIAIALATLSFQHAALGQQLAAPPSPPNEIEEEVLADLRRQPIGPATLGHHGYPESYLRRVADRVIRDSYERHYRIVVAAPGSQPASSPSSQPIRPTSIRWQSPDLDSWLQKGELESPSALADNYPGAVIVRALRQTRESLDQLPREEMRPPLRGWRARDDWPRTPPREMDDPNGARAARVVAEELSSRGLITTVAEAILVLGDVEKFANCGSVELRRLQAVGLPTDLLRHFATSEPGENETALGTNEDAKVVRWIAGRLQLSDGWFERMCDFRGRAFRFRPSEVAIARENPLAVESRSAALAGCRFRAADESGQSGIASIRLQLTRGTDWVATGDGGSVDIARQLARLPGTTPLQFAIETSQLADLWATMSSWPRSAGTAPRPIYITPSELPLAQWAQDACKFGVPFAGSARAPEAAAILPRYASRGEVGSMYVPGDTLASEEVTHPPSATVVYQSPLLFQGGDLILVSNPKTSRRILLIGEGQIHHNVALGLAVDHVVEAFRLEFDADECMVLPAVSFHIDFEVSVRAVGERLVAFVNDADAARDVILRAGIRTLEEQKVLSSAQAGGALSHLQDGRWREFMQTAVNPLMSRAVAHGQFPETLANAFSSGPADSGVGNFHRFLLAIDLYLAANLPENEIPADRPHGYIRAIRRRDADRRALHTQLGKAGFEVVPIPSLSDNLRGINYLNGIHTPTHYYMPAWGGYFKALDDAALTAFRKTLGGQVEIVPIYCSESQRRGGALRCAVAVVPAD